MNERITEESDQLPPFHVSERPLPDGRVVVREYDGDGYLNKRYIDNSSELTTQNVGEVLFDLAAVRLQD